MKLNDHGEVFKEVINLYSITSGHTKFLDKDNLVVILPNRKGIWQTNHLNCHYYGVDIRTLTGIELKSAFADSIREINDINRKLACGNFYVDEDGELMYKSFIPAETVTPTDITRVIKINMETIDAYMPRILKLLAKEEENTEDEEYVIIEGVNENDFVKFE